MQKELIKEASFRLTKQEYKNLQHCLDGYGFKIITIDNVIDTLELYDIKISYTNPMNLFHFGKRFCKSDNVNF